MGGAQLVLERRLEGRRERNVEPEAQRVRRRHGRESAVGDVSHDALGEVCAREGEVRPERDVRDGQVGRPGRPAAFFPCEQRPEPGGRRLRIAPVAAHDRVVVRLQHLEKDGRPPPREHERGDGLGLQTVVIDVVVLLTEQHEVRTRKRREERALVDERCGRGLPESSRRAASPGRARSPRRERRGRPRETPVVGSYARRTRCTRRGSASAGGADASACEAQGTPRRDARRPGRVPGPQRAQRTEECRSAPAGCPGAVERRDARTPRRPGAPP